MAEYLALRIIGGFLDYSFVISRKPDLKEGIDEALRSFGRGDLIVD